MMKQTTEVKLLACLYGLRQSARAVLEGDETAQKEMRMRFFDLAQYAEVNKAVDPDIKAIFNEIMPDVLLKISEREADVSELLELKPQEVLYPKDEIDKFNELKENLLAVREIRDKLFSQKGRTRRETVKEVEEKPETKALRAEVSRYLEQTRKLSDDEKKRAKKALDEADKLEVSTKKNSNRILVSFGEGAETFEASFSVSTKDLQIGTGISGYGGLEAVLGKNDAKAFAQVLTGHNKGKDYLTTRGLRAKAQQAKQKRASAKVLTEQKELAEAQKRVFKAEVQLKKAWQEMICRADCLEAGKAFGMNLTRTNNDDILRIIDENVLKSAALWSLYKEQEVAGKFDTQSEYGKLYKIAFGRAEFQKYIESGYSQAQNGVKEAGSLCLSKAMLYAKDLGLPEELGAEVLFDEVYKFGMPQNNGGKLEESRVSFMNSVLAHSGVQIGFSAHLVKEKCVEERLNDEIHKKDNQQPVKTYKKQMTALLYAMGLVAGASRGEADLAHNKVLKEQFLALNEKYDQATHSKDERPFKYSREAGQLIWEKFIANGDTIDKARQTVELINQEYGVRAQEVVLSMSRGDAVEGDSLHHVTYAYYAPLLGKDKKDLVKRFNAKDNTVEVLNGHVAKVDVHKDVEHRFNVSVGGNVLVKGKDETIRLCTVNSCKQGEVLMMPVLKVYDKESKSYKPLMRQGMLFMTSSGKFVDEPFNPAMARERSLYDEFTLGHGGRKGGR